MDETKRYLEENEKHERERDRDRYECGAFAWSERARLFRLFLCARSLSRFFLSPSHCTKVMQRMERGRTAICRGDAGARSKRQHHALGDLLSSRLTHSIARHRVTENTENYTTAVFFY